MDEALKIVLQIAAGAVLILPLVATYSIIKKVNDVAGKVGIKLPGAGLGEKVKKRADDYAKYRKNKEETNALLGNSRIPGKGRRVRRAYIRDMKRQTAESGLKSAQAQFGHTDPKASALVQQNLQNQRNMNAANAASGQTYMTTLAKQSSGYRPPGLSDAAANDEYMQKSLEAQQQKAITDAIEQAQLSVDIKPGPNAIDEMADKLTEAIKNNDSITARALQNMMLKSGGPGMDAYRETMAKAESADAGLTSSGLHANLRQNILSNHSGLKGSSNDIYKQASGGGTLVDNAHNADTWNLTDDEMAGQKKTAIKFADASGGLGQEQALRIVNSPELSKKLTPETRQMFEDIATRPTGTPPPPPPF